jgi:DNA-binding NarL/FixJ family response regulator
MTRVSVNAAPEARPGARIGVLCVDDHPGVRRALTVALSACPDLEVLGEARSGEEAVWLCSLLQPDVVLMDVVMPGLGGLLATSIIRTRWPEIQVIAITAGVEPGTRAQALEAGAVDLLTKNIDFTELLAAIGRAHRAWSQPCPASVPLPPGDAKSPRP